MQNVRKSNGLPAAQGSFRSWHPACLAITFFRAGRAKSTVGKTPWRVAYLIQSPATQFMITGASLKGELFSLKGESPNGVMGSRRKALHCGGFLNPIGESWDLNIQLRIRLPRRRQIRLSQGDSAEWLCSGRRYRESSQDQMRKG